MKEPFFKTLREYPYREKSLQLIYDTPIEVAIGAVVLSAAFGAVSYNVNKAKEGHIPIAFSEIGKTVVHFRDLGQPVPPLTKLCASANDTPMKVFESNNIALESNRSHDRFAGELESRVNPAIKVYRLISEYAAEIKEDAKRALASLYKIINASQDVPAVANALANTWGESHTDVTRTEWYSDTECDSKNNCRSVTKTREVYDHTIHSYTYHPQQGEAADRLMGAFLLKHPELVLAERLVPATKTSPDNEYAIERSMKKLLQGKIPMPEQSLTFANTAYSSCNVSKYYPVILANHAGLKNLSPAWTVAKTRARSITYNTGSHTDAGPKEYQITRNALASAQNIAGSTAIITGGIQFAAANIPRLDTQIKDYIAVALDGSKKGDLDAMRDALLENARDIYNKNFKDGLDVTPFKAGEVALYALIGGLLGGLGGFGVDRGIDAWRRRQGGRNYRL